MEIRGRAQEGNDDGSGDGNKSSGGDGSGDEDRDGDGDGDGIGHDGGETKKRKKPHKSCEHHLRNGGYLGGKRKKCRQERFASVTANRPPPSHTHTSVIDPLIPSREDQCEWHRMARMTGPECAVMRDLITTHTRARTYIHTHTHTPDEDRGGSPWTNTGWQQGG